MTKRCLNKGQVNIVKKENIESNRVIKDDQGERIKNKNEHMSTIKLLID